MKKFIKKYYNFFIKKSFCNVTQNPFGFFDKLKYEIRNKSNPIRVPKV